MTNVHFEPVTHTYRDDAGVIYPSVTQILRLAGLSSPLPISQERMEAAQARGTSVHWACHLADIGALNRRTVPQAMRGYLKADAAWKQASGFVVTESEQPFIFKWYGYAGTIDLCGTLPIKGRRLPVVVDRKTGAAIPISTRYQLVGYGIYRFGGPCRRVALLLNPDGSFSVKEYPLSQWATDLARWMEAVRKYGKHSAD